MKLTITLLNICSVIFVSIGRSAQNTNFSIRKNKVCPRTFLSKLTSESELMKLGSRCASIDQDDLAYQYYLKAIEAANYNSKVISKIAQHLKRKGKQELSNKIQNSVKSKQEAQRSTSEIYRKLLEWANTYKAKIGPIAIRELSAINRYFVSTRDILNGEVIMSIPQKMCLSTNHPELFQLKKEIDKNNSFKAMNEKHRVGTAFAIYLMRSIKERKGPFVPFFDSLPKTVNEYPHYRLLTSPQSIPFIKNSFLEETISSNLIQLKNDFELIKKIFPTLKSYKFEDFMQAGHMYSSRNFIVNVNGEKSIFMIPIADLFNHDHLKHNVQWRFNSQTKSVEIYATSDIKKGNEVFLSYGFKDSSDFLTGYGFVPNNYTGQTKFSFEDTDVLKGKSSNEGIIININTQGDAIFKVLSHYRRLFITSMRKDYNWNLPISIDNEKSSIKAIVSALSKRLSRYPTALQHDQIQIKNKNLTDLQRNIYRILVEEKKAFINTLKKLKLVTDVLNKYNPNNTHIIRRRLFSSSKDFMEYFETLRTSLGLRIFYD